MSIGNRNLEPTLFTPLKAIRERLFSPWLVVLGGVRECLPDF